MPPVGCSQTGPVQQRGRVIEFRTWQRWRPAAAAAERFRPRGNVKFLSLVEASLLIHPPARTYRSFHQDHVPAEVRRIFPPLKTLRFRVGGGSVLHLPPRVHLPGCLLLGGESPLPTLLPGQTLPAELWLCDREGRYYGTGFSWQGGIELSAVADNEAVRGKGDQVESAGDG
jgi:hypothetical protein